MHYYSQNYAGILCSHLALIHCFMSWIAVHYWFNSSYFHSSGMLLESKAIEYPRLCIPTYESSIVPGVLTYTYSKTVLYYSNYHTDIGCQAVGIEKINVKVSIVHCMCVIVIASFQSTHIIYRIYKTGFTY